MTLDEVLERLPIIFRRKTLVRGECWIWTGAQNGLSYGVVGRSLANPIRAYTHRLAFEVCNGPIPSGLVIDHLCRVPPCFNPAHLQVVTQRENLLRGTGFTARFANQTHCINGHRFDANNTRVVRPGRSRVWRLCRECHRIGERNRRLKQKLQRLTDGGEYAVSFTPMSEIIRDAEKAMLGRVMATGIADTEAAQKGQG